MKRSRKNLFPVLLATALACAAAPASAAEETMVRVAVLQDADSVRVTLQAPCRLTDLQKGTMLAEWPQLKWQETAAAGSGLRIGKHAVSSSAVVLTPSNPNAVIRVNSRPYRGSLILRRTAKGKLTVINRLPLEEYLAGALAS